MSRKNDAILELLSGFIQLRQTGMVRDAAWQQILRQASEIPLGTEEVMQLLNLAKSWEKREGYKYHYDERDSTQTELLDPGKLNNLQSDALDETEATVTIENGINEKAIEDTACFTDDTLLVLLFDASATPLKIPVVQGKEVVIGRSTPSALMTPDVDLSVMGVDASGVSRMHASIQRRGNTLLMTDLGSRNFTYVNGARLHPHEIRVLKHGDELRLANLRATIFFIRT